LPPGVIPFSFRQMARKFPFFAVAALAFGAGCSDDPAANDGAPTASPPVHPN